MSLQTSGAISLGNIQTEFGGSNPISLSEYYGKGGVTSSGVISIGTFYGKHIGDISGSWSGNSYSYSTPSGNAYGYFRLYVSGSQFRIALYSCGTCSGRAWRYSTWATAYTSGTFSNVNSTVSSGYSTLGTVTLKTGTSAGGANRITLGSGTVYYTVGTGFTGSSVANWMYNGGSKAYLQTSGGKIRTYSNYFDANGHAGAWISLT